VFGGKSDSRKLPITKGFDTEVVGETADSLRSIVSEHKGWLSTNCQRQIDSYWCACPPAEAAEGGLSHTFSVPSEEDSRCPSADLRE
jgi:hypothetical protein